VKVAVIFLSLSVLALTGCRSMLEQPYDRERAAARSAPTERSSNAEPAEPEQSTPARKSSASGQSVAPERSAVSEESAPSHDTRVLTKKTETFTGKVVLTDGAYRLALAKEPGTLLRLTRAHRRSEFEKEQILLRKYYEKIISVNGTRQDDWIWSAEIIGQWVPQGAPTGANMNAPEQTRP
jgi:hypothetical protein